MKRILPIFVSLALMIAYGCDEDDDDSKTINPETNAPSRHEEDPPQYCLPANYSAPPSPVWTNSTVSTTQTIGLPGDPYYQVTVTAVVNNTADYSDGTKYESKETTITDTIANSGTTNSTQSINHEISIILFDNTQLTSSLIEHSTNGIQDQRQYDAFLECSDGTVTAITEEQFDAFRAQLGI